MGNFSSTWDPMYPDPVCHPILEDLRNCVVSKERKGVGLVCSKTKGIKVSTLVPFSVAPLNYKTCSEEEVFSMFRRKCVRFLIT